mgnify:CR=1 FL=1
MCSSDLWQNGNDFGMMFVMAVRAGYRADRVIEAIKGWKPERNGVVSQKDGGGIETAGIVEAINGMLLQSHDGVVRIFPSWNRALDAEFKRLRAVGAFLVGFLATRASWLGGLIYGIVCTIVVILVLQQPAGRLFTGDSPVQDFIVSYAAWAPVGAALSSTRSFTVTGWPTSPNSGALSTLMRLSYSPCSPEIRTCTGAFMQGACTSRALSGARASCTWPSVIMIAPARRCAGMSFIASVSAVNSRVPSGRVGSDLPARTVRTSRSWAWPSSAVSFAKAFSVRSGR